MVVDTSAIIAIIFNEPEAGAFRQLIQGHPHPVMSAASYAEAGIVVTQRLSPTALDDLDIVLTGAGVEILPATIDQAVLAIRAYERFGKGRHPAGLNYGDCFSYALAQARGNRCWRRVTTSYARTCSWRGETTTSGTRRKACLQPARSGWRLRTIPAPCGFPPGR